MYSKTAGVKCGEARVQADTNFWPKLCGSTSRWLQIPHPTSSSATSTSSTAFVHWEDTYKSLLACFLRGESFLFMLANVLQVLPWGSVIVGHLRHRWREGNYWGGLPKRTGCVQGMRNTFVCIQRLPHAHLKALWHQHTLTFSISCAHSGLQNTHIQE